MSEFCIMPPDENWETERIDGYHRHEVFFGVRNRQKSIDDGLVIFLPPALHNQAPAGIHFNREFDLYAKRIAERRWLEYYNKTIEDFIERYGKSYL